jgi:hypothetical protein
MHEPVLLAHLPALLAILGRQRPRVGEGDEGGAGEGVDAAAGDVDADGKRGARRRAERDAAEVAAEGDGAVGFGIEPDGLARGEVLEPVGDKVGMRVAEEERPELGDVDEGVRTRLQANVIAKRERCTESD